MLGICGQQLCTMMWVRFKLSLVATFSSLPRNRVMMMTVSYLLGKASQADTYHTNVLKQ